MAHKIDQFAIMVEFTTALLGHFGSWRAGQGAPSKPLINLHAKRTIRWPVSKVLESSAPERHSTNCSRISTRNVIEKLRMFGIVRTLWACMVVFGHLFWVSDFGRFAVFGFYILSGYLMTYVMHKSYGYHQGGRKKFLLNRTLRLYPTYWFACLLSLFLLIVLNDYMPEDGFSSIAPPTDLISIAGNITMIFPHWMPNLVEPRLSPAAWALTVEIFFYIAICMGISKTLKRTVIWACLSLVFVVASYGAGLYWHARYFSIPAGSLPFSIGSLIFFSIKHEFVPAFFNRILRYPEWILAAMVGLATYVSFQIPRGMNIFLVEALFYTNMIICALLVLSIATGNNISNQISKRWDKIVGDFSYPIYLLHYQVCMIVSALLLGKVELLKNSMSIYSLALIFLGLILVSLVSIRLIDRPIEIIRDRIRD